RTGSSGPFVAPDATAFPERHHGREGQRRGAERLLLGDGRAPAGTHGLEEGAHLRLVSLVAPLPALHGGALPSAMKGRRAEVVDHDGEAGAMDLDPLLRERGVAAREIVDSR